MSTIVNRLTLFHKVTHGLNLVGRKVRMRDRAAL